MSAVQALAALLSSNADSSSRVAAAQIGANAAATNANAALQGDLYRANMQGTIGANQIAAESQRAAAEMGLRRFLAGRQMGMDSQRLGLMREQLGLDRERLTSDRDIKLGELGIGPYAPQAPNLDGLFDDGGSSGGIMGLFKGMLGGDQPRQSGDLSSDIARRMIMANPGNARLLGSMLDVIRQGQSDQLRRDEFDWKKGAVNDPNILFSNLMPTIAGMEGMTPDKLFSVIPSLKAALQGTQMPTTSSPQTPSFTEAAAALGDPSTSTLMQALGIGDDSTAWQMGEAIGERAGSLTEADIAMIQRAIAAKAKSNPALFNDQAADHPGVRLLRKLLDSPAAGLQGTQLQQDYANQRAEYFKTRNDPREYFMFGIPKPW